MPRRSHVFRGWGVALLLCVAAAGGPGTALAETGTVYPPSTAHLQSALESYRTIEGQGGWPMVPDGPALRIGSFGSSVVRLRERLAVTSDLTGPAGNSPAFDEDLSAAVMGFQSRHGLAVDGVVGRRTCAALNVPAGDRVRQLSANLARLRSFPDTGGHQTILINVAAFDLHLVEDGKVTFGSPVIVGRLSRPTPLLSSFVTQIIVNPYWRIPRRIATSDILPQIKRDEGYLRHQVIRVFKSTDGSPVEVAAESVNWPSLNRNNFPYLLVQDPGPLNALGQVKFFVPNEQDIFVHDTAARQLFEHERRAFSSGCIRVRRAVELAEHLLKQEGDDSLKAMAGALQSGKTVSIALTDPVPLHIVYLTAWADRDGRAHFRDDIYSLDTPADATPAQVRAAHRDMARAREPAFVPSCPTMRTPTGIPG